MIRTIEDLRALPRNATIWPRGFPFPVSRTVPGEPAGLEWNAPGERIGHTASEIPLPAAVIYNPWDAIERPDLVTPVHQPTDSGGGA